MKRLSFIFLAVLIFNNACNSKAKDESYAINKSLENIDRASIVEGEIMGDWIWNRKVLSQRNILHKIDDQLLMVTIFEDGSRIVEEMEYKGDTLEEKGGNFHGEYHFIRNGILEFHGNDGKFGEGIPKK